MKRIVALFFIMSFCLSVFQAKALDNFTSTEIEGLNVIFNSNAKIAKVEHIKRGERFNSWYFYEVSFDSNGNIILSPLAEVKDDMRGTTFVANEKPKRIVISDVTTDKPRMTGQFNTSLSSTNGGGITENQRNFAFAMIDYNEHPEEYSPDSVAKLNTDAWALNSTYIGRQKQIANDNYKLIKAHDARLSSRNSMTTAIIIIPFILTLILFVMMNRYIGRRKTEQLSKLLKWIALGQFISLPLMVIAIYHFYCAYWWVITLAVIAIIAIEAMNIFFGYNLRDYTINSLHEKFPTIPAIITGVIGMMVAYGIISYLILVFSDVAIAKPQSEYIIGIVVSFALLVGLVIWVKKSLSAHTPDFKGKYLAISIIALFSVIGVVCLMIFILAIIMFKGVGKAFFNESVNLPSSSLKPSQNAEHSCSRCGRLGDYSCPHFRDDGTATTSCSSWIPK